MGGLCGCFHVSEPDDSTSDGCFCPGCLFQKFKNKHFNPSSHRQTNGSSRPNQQAPAANPALASNNASASSGPQVEVLARTTSSGERGREPNGEREVQVDTKSLQGVKVVLYPNPVGSHSQRIKSYAKALTSDFGGFEFMFPNSNYEDECPTCLEEYTPENPRITAKCNHHYHLSCIYEWMERNENCPVCGKLMLFDE